MNTERSEAIITRFKNLDWEPKRIVFEHQGVVYGAPQEVFSLLCPAREADWIPTWEADVIYSETGYSAKGDVFRTPESTGFGEGVWVFIGYEGDHYVELVQTTADILAHLKVSVAPLDADGAGQETLVRWNYVLTSLTPEGAAKMTADLLSEERFTALVAAMDHYMRHGEMVRFPSAD